MTNREHYKEQILDIVSNGVHFAVNKETGVILSCTQAHCSTCVFINREDPFGCGKLKKKWCDEEYTAPCPFKKDELVEVSDNNVNWRIGHFSHITEYGKYAAFVNGKASKETKNVNVWTYCQKYGTLGGIINED